MLEPSIFFQGSKYRFAKSGVGQPGLYALGKPGKQSEIFVTANYKYSLDLLRKSLRGRDAWILVLNTKGINVWCAAGKGTFGTSELVLRIRAVRLEQYVDHRRIILPQPGASPTGRFSGRFRPFALKGFVAGLATAIIIVFSMADLSSDLLLCASALLLFPATSSLLALPLLS